MHEPRSPFPSESRQEFLTIRISKMTAMNGLLAVMVVVALVGLAFRERANRRVAGNGPAVTSEEKAIASSSTAQKQPEGVASAPRFAAQPLETKSADPLPSPENRPPAEPAVDSPVAYPSESPVVEMPQGQATRFESPSTNVADVQPESKPEDAPPEPPNQPDPPVAPSAPASNSPLLPPARSSSPLVLSGAGAIFPHPLYSKWFDEYCKVNPRIQFHYQAIGSGAGVYELLAGMVDFGAIDIPAFDEQLAKAKPAIVRIPMVVDAIVPIYNIPGLHGEVKFTPEVLAGIYLGKIVSWDDPAIEKVNPTLNLPYLPIVAIHRWEGSDATFTFTDYLSKVNFNWQKEVGKGTTVNWPVGLAAKGNEGAAGVVRQTGGAIGYVDLLYAQSNHLPFGSVANAAGQFVKASLRSVTEAAASVTELPQTSGISITDAPGKEAYPIASFTWFLVSQRLRDPVKARDLAMFLHWTTVGGQRLAENLGYAPLPEKLVPQVLKIIAQLR